MKTLITPQQVHRHAFAGGEPLAPDAVSVADIAAAEAAYLRPVVGEAMHDALLEGRYPNLVADYLLTALALLTRFVVQPRLDLHTTRIGTLAPKADNGSSPDAVSLDRLRKNLRHEAMQLLRRASEHLDAEAARYPEYDPHANIFHRCTTDGGFVQIF